MRDMLSFGPVTVDVTHRIVTKDGAPLRMTLKCIELLVAFVCNPGKTLTKEQLLEAAWHDPEASDATLAQHVFLLRRALGADAKCIKTVPQKGYRFDAAVSGELPGRAEAPAEFVMAADEFRALNTEQGLRSAIDLYTRAIEAEPGEARSYARRAGCWRLLAEFMYADPYTTLMSAKGDAGRALALNGEDAEALIESAYSSALFDRDIAAALQYADLAALRDPGNAAARMLHVFLPLMRGQTAAALNASRGAGGSLAGAALYFARAYTKAIPYFEASAADNPGANVMLGACKLFSGDAQGAIAAFREVYGEHVDVRRAGRPNVRHYALALSIYAMAKNGDRVRARKAVTDLAALSRQRYVSPMARAIAHVGLGEHDVALALVEEAVARFDPWAAYIGVDPFLDALRDDPRFVQIIGRIAA